MNWSAENDESLIEHYLEGNQEAFAELYRRYFTPVFDFVARTLRDRQAASDVVQDTFVKAHRNLKKLRSHRSFKPWIYAIARNQTLTYLRRNKHEIPTPTQPDPNRKGNPLLSRIDPSRFSNPEAASEASQQAALVWEAAASLSPKDYMLLDLTVRQGLDSSELAQVLEVQPGAAYTALSRAKAKLKARISHIGLVQSNSSCEELASLVQSFDGKLPQSFYRRTEKHVSKCSICSERKAGVLSPTHILGVMAIIPAPIGAMDAVFAAIPVGKAVGAAAIAAKVVGVTAVTAAVVGAGIFVANQPNVASLPVAPATSTTSPATPTSQLPGVPATSTPSAAQGTSPVSAPDNTEGPTPPTTTSSNISPEVTISAPQSTGTYVATLTDEASGLNYIDLSVNAIGLDDQDAPMDLSYSWRSDREPGTWIGHQTRVRLYVHDGDSTTHKITVLVTDSDGGSTTQSVTIVVSTVKP